MKRLLLGSKKEGTIAGGGAEAPEGQAAGIVCMYVCMYVCIAPAAAASPVGLSWFLVERAVGVVYILFSFGLIHWAYPFVPLYLVKDTYMYTYFICPQQKALGVMPTRLPRPSSRLRWYSK